MLHLIKQWIVVPVEEEDGRGGKRRTAEARHRKRGIPQGAPISPLLSNMYMLEGSAAGERIQVSNGGRLVITVSAASMSPRSA